MNIWIVFVGCLNQVKMPGWNRSIPKIVWDFQKDPKTFFENNFLKIWFKQLKLSDHIELEKWIMLEFQISNFSENGG